MLLWYEMLNREYFNNICFVNTRINAIYSHLTLNFLERIVVSLDPLEVSSLKLNLTRQLD
jgi:hypothetical protein